MKRSHRHTLARPRIIPYFGTRSSRAMPTSVLIVGDDGVGKTSLVHAFVSRTFGSQVRSALPEMCHLSPRSARALSRSLFSPMLSALALTLPQCMYTHMPIHAQNLPSHPHPTTLPVASPLLPIPPSSPHPLLFAPRRRRCPRPRPRTTRCRSDSVTH